MTGYEFYVSVSSSTKWGRWKMQNWKMSRTCILRHLWPASPQKCPVCAIAKSVPFLVLSPSLLIPNSFLPVFPSPPRIAKKWFVNQWQQRRGRHWRVRRSKQCERDDEAACCVTRCHRATVIIHRVNLTAAVAGSHARALNDKPTGGSGHDSKPVSQWDLARSRQRILHEHYANISLRAGLLNWLSLDVFLEVKMVKNGGEPPPTPKGELTAIPQTPLLG